MRKFNFVSFVVVLISSVSGIVNPQVFRKLDVVRSRYLTALGLVPE